MKILKRFLVVMMILCVTISFFYVNVEASTSMMILSNNVDVSGQGTVLDYPIRSGQATHSFTYAYIPTYKGKYENQQILVNDWWLHNWNNWATYNNRTNDYYTYKGETITEYDTESKIQNQYKRWDPEMGILVGTLYITEYKGSRWYNSFITKTKTSTTGYPGSIANYYITDRYTEPYIAGYEGGYDYDYTWCDSKPSSSTEYEWIAWSTRNVYRYRSRDITWNNKAISSLETVPVNYGFNDLNGNDLGIIRWQLVKTISEYEDYPNSSVDLTQYFITSQAIVNMLDKDLVDISYQLNKEGYIDLGAFIALVIEGGAINYLPQAIVPQVSTLIAVINTYFAANEIYTRAAKRLTLDRIKTMQDYLSTVGELQEVMVMSYTSQRIDGVYNSYDVVSFDTVVLDYVSMHFMSNGVDYNYATLSDKDYGIISYGVSDQEIYYVMQTSIMNQYPSFLPWSNYNPGSGLYDNF